MKSFSLVKKLHEYKLKKTPNVMIFVLVLRNTSISSYRILLEDFPFLSLLLLEKINSGATDAANCVQNAGKISENACLWKYFAGDTMFQTSQFSKNYFSISSLSENNREFGFHITGYFAGKIKSKLSCFVVDFWWVIQSPVALQTFGTCKFQGE